MIFPHPLSVLLYFPILILLFAFEDKYYFDCGGVRPTLLCVCVCLLVFCVYLGCFVLKLLLYYILWLFELMAPFTSKCKMILTLPKNYYYFSNNFFTTCVESGCSFLRI